MQCMIAVHNASDSAECSGISNMGQRLTVRQPRQLMVTFKIHFSGLELGSRAADP